MRRAESAARALVLAVASVLWAACGGQEALDGTSSGLGLGRGVTVRIDPTRSPPFEAFPGEGFGHAVALGGSLLAASDFLDLDQAHVHVYDLAGGAPVEVAQLWHPTVERCFGRTLALGRTSLAVGAPCFGAGAGEVHLFELSAGAWVELPALLNPASAEASRFGHALAAAGNRVVVGAPWEAGGAGAAYVFVRGGQGWRLEARLAPADPLPGDRFGFAVSMTPGALAVTAPGRASPDPLGPTGRVHVFALGAGGWVEEVVLAPAPLPYCEAAAQGVAITGSGVAITGDPYLSHSVHVFTRAPDGWVEQDVDEPLRGATDCGFAHSLAMDGDLLVVGMPTLAGPGGEYRAGGAWVYQRRGLAWERTLQVEQLPPGDGSVPYGKVGHAVAVSGGTVAVGAPGAYQPGMNMGYGYVLVTRL